MFTSSSLIVVAFMVQRRYFRALFSKLYGEICLTFFTVIKVVSLIHIRSITISSYGFTTTCVAKFYHDEINKLIKIGRASCREREEISECKGDGHEMELMKRDQEM